MKPSKPFFGRFTIVYHSNPRWRGQQQCKFNVFCVNFWLWFPTFITDSYDNHIFLVYMTFTLILKQLMYEQIICGHTVGWIKMKLGMEVDFGPDHIVLDGDPAPPSPQGHSPHFSAHVYCGETAGWIKMPLGAKVGLGPDDIVLYGDPALPLKMGTAPTLRTMSIVAKRLDGPRCHLVRR